MAHMLSSCINPARRISNSVKLSLCLCLAKINIKECECQQSIQLGTQTNKQTNERTASMKVRRTWGNSFMSQMSQVTLNKTTAD